MRKIKFLSVFLISLFLILGIFAPDTRAGCGDVNEDDEINVLDIIEMIPPILQIYPYPEPPPLELADINGDMTLNILDIVQLINYVFICDVGCDQYLDCPLTNHEESSSGCLPLGQKSDSTIIFEVNGSDLTIYHYGANYNCCLDYFVEYSIGENSIVAQETDNGLPCDCYCNFDLTSTLYSIPPGTYQVQLYGIEGGLLGEEEITIFKHFETSSDCLTKYDSGNRGWISIGTANNDLYIYHYGVYFNCNGAGYYVNYNIEGSIITAEEDFRGIPFNCNCYFNFQSTLYDIAPGAYTVRFYDIEGELLAEEPIQIN